MLEESGLLTIHRGPENRPNRLRIPRHISVPFFAGILVTVMGLLMVHFSSLGHKASLARAGKTDSSRPYAGQLDSDFEGNVKTVARSRMAEAADILSDSSRIPAGPELKLLKPTNVELVAGRGPSQPFAVADDKGCVELGQSNDAALLRVHFSKPSRLSHLTLEACEPTKEAGAGRLLISMEDGTRREVALPRHSRTITVDLAGAWSSQITIEGKDSARVGMSLDNLQFYAFGN